MTSILQFTAKPASRHPRNIPASYDKTNHRYAPGYIRPSKWTIRITHALAQERDQLKAKIALINPRPDKPNFDKMMAAKQRLVAKLNEMEAELNRHEVQFTISQPGGFSRKSAVNDYNPSLEVPAFGIYSITITAKKRNGASSSRSESLIFRDILIVSLGDSIAAGEGNPDRVGNPTKAMKRYAERGSAATLKAIKEDIGSVRPGVPNVTPELHFAQWQEPLAHRSYLSGHSLAASRVESNYNGLHLVTTFLPFSRSGAKSDNGLIRYNGDKDYRERRLFLEKKPLRIKREVVETNNPGSLDSRLRLSQIDEARAAVGNRKIDFLVITIGANDIEWSSNFTNLVKLDSEFPCIPLSFGGSGDREGRAVLQEIIERGLRQLQAKFDALNQKIRETLDPRFVLLTEYPRGFFGSTDRDGNETVTKGCGVFDTPFDADVDLADAKLIRDLSDQLNAELKRAAQRHGWIFVDGIANEFGKHGYCNRDTYFVSAEKSFKTQGDWYGMLHPNAKGHGIYARQITAKIQETIQANLDTFRPRPGITPVTNPVLEVTI